MATRRSRRRMLRGLALLALALPACGGDDPPRRGPAARDQSPTVLISRTTATRVPPTPPPTPPPPQVCLVTRARGVGAGYVPPDLITLPRAVIVERPVQLRQEAAQALLEMISTAQSEAGLRLLALSGYRSYQEQERVLTELIGLLGEPAARRQAAPPGHSEHQLGLAVDVVSPRRTAELEPVFGTEPEGLWVAANAARFGYVISYPAGKEAITGYVYEPWHIRHVGVAVAQKVVASGKTLTEYLPTNGMADGCP